jgi:hypothetical protein
MLSTMTEGINNLMDKVIERLKGNPNEFSITYRFVDCLDRK